MATMKTLVAALCVLTLLAVAYLSLSLIVLRPLRANYRVWFVLATFLSAQGALTLAALGTNIATDGVVRGTVLVSAGVLGAIGVWMVRDTLTSAHFEGHALVLGSMLVLQGALTIGVFLKPRMGRIAG